MKTLYININNEQIQSNEELEVLKHDLDSDFFFYLGEKIAKGCNVENENALITDFNTPNTEEDYKQIIAQWNEIKAILFSEECKGKFEFTLPNGYIHWLKFHPQYVSVYDRNYSNGGPTVITIDLEELYEDSVEDLQSMILRKLQRDGLYLEIDEIVFNDEAVTRKSPIARAIKEQYDGIGFKTYKKWSQENEEKPHTSSQVCEKCKKNPCECKRYEDLFFPIEGVALGQLLTDVNKKLIVSHIIDNYVTYKPINGITYSGFNGVLYGAYVDYLNEFPSKWQRLLGFTLGEEYKKVKKDLINKGFTINMDYNQRSLIVSSPCNVYLLFFEFTAWDSLRTMYIIINKCPYCGFGKFDYKLIDDNEFIPICKKCGKTYIPINEEVINFEDVPDDIDDDLHNFFPVAGITLGKTTIEEIEGKDYLYDKISYFDANGIATDSYKEDSTTIVWYKGIQMRKEHEDDVITHIYMTNSKLFFSEWEKFGFNWSLSYIEWKNLFLEMGYSIQIEEEPHKEWDTDDGYWYLNAVFRVYAPDYSIQFKLEFSFGEDGYYQHSKNTLYSIDVYSSNSSDWNN